MGLGRKCVRNIPHIPACILWKYIEYFKIKSNWFYLGFRVQSKGAIPAELAIPVYHTGWDPGYRYDTGMLRPFLAARLKTPFAHQNKADIMLSCWNVCFMLKLLIGGRHNTASVHSRYATAVGRRQWLSSALWPGYVRCRQMCLPSHTTTTITTHCHSVEPNFSAVTHRCDDHRCDDEGATIRSVINQIITYRASGKHIFAVSDSLSEDISAEYDSKEEAFDEAASIVCPILLIHLYGQICSE